jgi:hypothetical protein
LLVTPECLINQNQKWLILEFELIHHQIEKLFFESSGLIVVTGSKWYADHGSLIHHGFSLATHINIIDLSFISLLFHGGRITALVCTSNIARSLGYAITVYYHCFQTYGKRIFVALWIMTRVEQHHTSGTFAFFSEAS